MKQREPETEYIVAVQKIEEVLNALKEAADEHFYADPDYITWGNVGTANHILQLLYEVAAFAGIGEE